MAAVEGEEAPLQVKGFLEDDHHVQPEEQESQGKVYEFLDKAKESGTGEHDVDPERVTPLVSGLKEDEEEEEEDGEGEGGVGESSMTLGPQKLGTAPSFLRMSVSVRKGWFSSSRVTYLRPSLLGFDMKGRQLLFATSTADLRRRPTRIPFSNIDSIELANDDEQFGFYIHLLDASKVSIIGPDSKLTFQTATAEEAEKYVNKLRANIFMIATVYTVGKDGKWPEMLLDYKTETGVCFSGGGARSHVCVTGQLRALRDLGVLNKNDLNYISATSGGAWAASIFTFYERGAKNDDDLLGKGTEPEEMFTEVLQKPPCPLASPAQDVMWQEMRRIFWSTPSPELWEQVLGNVYFERFGMNKEVPFGMRELVPTIRYYNRALAKAKINQTRPNRPFLVLHANMIGPEWADASDVVPIQFTPMYCGTPYMRRVHYKEAASRKSHRQGLYKIGGGFIDTFAFGAEVPKAVSDKHKVITRKWVLADMFGKVAQNIKNLSNEARDLLHRRHDTGNLLKHFIRVPAPERPFSLRHAVGISSDGPALMYKNKRFRDQLNPRGHYFSPTGLKDRAKEKELDLVMEFSDGGVTDNLAIMPLLQRKVKRIIAFSNSEIPLIPIKSKDVDHLKYSTIAQLWPTTNILPLFGVHFDEKTMEEKVTKYFTNLGENQVFHTYRVKDLIKAMLEKKEKGEPQVVVQRYEVVPNDFWNVQGFWDVEVMWVFLGKCREFNEKLPDEVQEEIKKGYAGEFGGFPNFKTFGQRKEFHIDPSLTVQQINLLSSQTEYALKRNADLVQDFVRGKLKVEVTESQKMRNRQSQALREIEQAGYD